MSRYGPEDDDPGQPGGRPDHPGGPYRPPSDPWGQRPDPWSDLTVPQPGPERPPPTRDQPPPGSYDRPAPGAHRRPPHEGHPPGSYPPAEPPGWAGPPTRAQPAWDEQPTWTPTHGRPGGGGQAPWRPTPTAAAPRRRGLPVALLVVFVLLLAGGVAGTLFWLAGDGSPGAGSPSGLTAGPSGEPSATATATGEGDGQGERQPPPERIGMGPQVAQPGDCLVNDGSRAEPEMRIVPCDTDESTEVYRVLARFDQQVTGDTAEEQDRSAQEICAGTEDYAHHYRLVADDPEDSFVLCMDDE